MCGHASRFAGAVIPGVFMELRMFCAYNQTRECFLGLEVTAGDFSYEALSRAGALTIKPNEGLWLCPFRGIPEFDVPGPMDLIYLNKDCRVIDLMESFPSARGKSSIPAVDTVLVLPAHSIFLSETRIGDQLVLRAAEEMPGWLERQQNGANDIKPGANKKSSFVSAMGRKALEFVGLEPGSRHGRPNPDVPVGVDLPGRDDPASGEHKKWFQRLWSRDLRQSSRKRVGGLAAYYWNGLPPSPHEVRDISSSGLYLLTEDRWYPGTVILMTLQDKSGSGNDADHAIPVRVRAVRWDSDGVGLQFVVETGAGSLEDPYVSGTGRERLDKFLARFGGDEPRADGSIPSGGPG